MSEWYPELEAVPQDADSILWHQVLGDSRARPNSHVQEVRQRGRGRIVIDQHATRTVEHITTSHRIERNASRVLDSTDEASSSENATACTGDGFKVGVPRLWHAIATRPLAIASVNLLKIGSLRTILLGNAENRGRSFEILRETRQTAKFDFELLDRTKAARLLGCSVRSFTRLRQKEGFPRPILKSRWLRSELIAWAMSQRS